MSRQMWSLLRISVAAVLTLSTVVVGGPVLAAADEPPGPPTNIVLTRAGPGAVKVTWDTPKETGSGPILSQTATAYRKGLIDSKGAWWEKSSGECRVTATRGRVSCTIRNLPNGTYNIRVLAWTSAGNNTTILSDPLITVQPNPAVGVACASKGEVTQVKERYFECGANNRWRVVRATGPCLKLGAITPTLYCGIASNERQWMNIPNSLGAIPSPECAIQASVFLNFISCAREAEKQQPIKGVQFSFFFDPRIHQRVRIKAKELAQWTVPLFQGILKQVPFTPEVDIIISLSYDWCVKSALPSFLGRTTPAPTAEEKYIYCKIGGANGGHSNEPKNGRVLLRIPQDLMSAFKDGTEPALGSFELNGIMTSEIGHTMRGFLAEAMRPGCGSACNAMDRFPNWTAYLGNSVVAYLGMLNAGWSNERVELNQLWQENPVATWMPKYSDPRLKCSGNPDLFAGVHPNNYSMQVAAAQYLVGSYGLDWVFQSLFPALVLRDCELDKVARSLWGGEWSDLETRLNDYLLSQLRRAGIAVPNN